jgi:hypothetical protein
MRARLGAAALAAALLLPSTMTGCVAEQAPERPTVDEVSVDPHEFADDLAAGLDAGTTAHLTTTLHAPDGYLTMTGVIDRTTDPVRMAGDLRVRLWRPVREQWRTERIDARSVDGTMYLSLGRRFVSYELDEPETLPPYLVSYVGLLDPLARVGDVARAVESVTSTGSRQIAGESLTQYELTVDVQDLEEAERITTDQLTYTLWVDEQFRVRELSYAIELDGESSEVRVRLYAWGEPVEIEAPPARLVLAPPSETV